MAIDRKALLSGVVGNAKVFESGDYLRAGLYEDGGLEIKNIIVDQKRSGLKFIVEFIVRKSKANGELDQHGKPCIPHAVGTQPAFLANLGDVNGLGAGDMAKFLGALDDEDPKTFTPDQLLKLAEGYSAPDQPGRGMLIDDSGFVKPTKGKGQDFTHHRWKNVPQTNEEIAARRAAQEKKAA